MLEALGVQDAGTAAGILAHDYISDRSIAIVQRRSVDSLEIGSGTLVEADGRLFVATVAHNLVGADAMSLSLMPGGLNREEKLRIIRMAFEERDARGETDVGFVEVEMESAEGLPRFTLADLAIGSSDSETFPCASQGYPAAAVAVQDALDRGVIVESDGFFTLSLPPTRRRFTGRPDIDLVVEWPPHDGSLDHLVLPDPPGISGGGIGRVQPFEGARPWLLESTKLIGLNRRWSSSARELVATRIEVWLEFLRREVPDVTAAISLVENWDVAATAGS